MLSPGEIIKGQYITIYSWNPVESAHEDFMTGSITTTTRQNNSWVGDVLRVECVQLPFVIVHYFGSSCSDKKRTIDTRKCVLMELNEDFVKIQLGEIPQ